MRLFSAVLLSTTFLIPSAYAVQENGTATAEVTLIPLTAMEDVGLSFGTITPDQAPGTVTLDEDNDAVGSGNILATGALSGRWIVTGQPDFTYNLVIASPNPLSTGGAEPDMPVSLSSTAAPTPVLDESGGHTFLVGGTLEVAANQPAGNYSATYTVDLNY